MIPASGTSNTAPSSKNAEKHSAWRAYSRLITFAWRYKTRLAISLFFALIIAASFGAMLISVGSIIRLTFYEPPAVSDNSSELSQDPADKLAADVDAITTNLRSIIGWAPKGLSDWIHTTVMAMRADRMRAVIIAAVLMLLLSFIMSVARFMQEYLAGSIGANITTDLGGEMYENLMRQSVGFFEKNSSGEILSRFTNDIFMVNRGLQGVFVKLMREPIKIAIFLIVALSIDWQLTLVGVCVLPLVLYMLMGIGKKMRSSVRKSLQKIAGMATVVNETIKGIFIIKGYNMEAYEVSRVRNEIARLRKFLLRMVTLHAITGPLTEFLLVLGIVAFVLFSGRRVESGLLDAGDLVQLYFALAMMLDPVRKLSDVNNLIQTSVASAERCFEFIDMKPDIEQADDAASIGPLRESIRFENVSFSYDGERDALKDINIEIRKGEMIALVGPSGSGKSTFAKLLPRFYDPSQGTVSIDGLDIRKITFASLREQMSIVTQDTILFAEKIRDNIAFGRTSYDDARIREAAVAAYADEFIRQLPHGYETLIGESGCTLSGGQRQRLAIARAIIKDPALLVLDEATSSLDTESERMIQEALDHFVKGRTTVVIAHRLSTIQRADRILVMDAGRIVEQGTMSELLASDSLYKRLHDTQFAISTNNNNG
ncbi:MAG: ABC transporter ATP-binding protein [Candidatus Hydrogenedentes bacterium]|nr:ABC transporter ATP-binding protein [Candidatus Hydrogenedentota bacterium]